MDRLLQDLRYAVRGLAAQPLFAFVVVASLAVAIGANAAVFGLVDRILLRKLPVADPDGWVFLEWSSGPEFPADSLSGTVSFDAAGRPTSTSFSAPAFRAFAAAEELTDVIAFTALDRVNVGAGNVGASNVGGSGNAFLAQAEAVSGSYYRSLGIVPRLGRLVEEGDDRPGAPPVVVLSEPLWRQRFGGSPTAIGSAVSIGGITATVVGVAPASFRGIGEIDQPAELTLALATTPLLQRAPGLLEDAGNWWLHVMARVPAEAREARSAIASARLRAAVLAWKADYPQPELVSVRLQPGGQGLGSSRASFRRPLVLLVGILTVVLALACANVASLLLVRSLRRRHELAMRLALGAGRGRVVRQLLTEGLVLSTAGAAFGLLLAGWLRDLLPAALRLQATAQLPAAELDLRALVFAALLALLTGLGFGLLPALSATRLDLVHDLRGRGATAGRSRLGGTLVVLQVALSVALLTLACLSVLTLRNLGRQSLGFEPDGVVQVRLDPSLAGYAPEAQDALRGELLRRLGELPGVDAVGVSTYGPLTGSSSIASVKAVDGKPLEDRTYLGVNAVDPGYFATLGIAIRRGRAIDPGDRRGGPPVAVIDERAATTLFGSEDPLGRRLTVGATEREIVGLTGPIKAAHLRGGVDETLFLPLDQSERPVHAVTFELRTAGDPVALLSAVRRATAAAAPDLALSELSTQHQLLARATSSERTFATLSSAFAVVAAGLAGLGLFALLSLLVARRTLETGVRLALGATPADVVQGVLRHSLGLAIAGVVLGLPLVPLAGRWADELLFGVTTRDPWSAGLAALAMLAVALAGAALPALRAGRVDPASVLRGD